MEHHLFFKFRFYLAVQKNSVPAAAGAVATSHTVFLLNRVMRDSNRFPFRLEVINENYN